MKLQKFVLNKQTPIIDLIKESELNKYARIGVRTFDIDFIKMKSEDPATLSLKVTFEDKRLVLPIFKHQFDLKYQNQAYYLDTSTIQVFQKLELFKILAIKVETETPDEDFEVTLYCTTTPIELEQNIQYLV